jgi:NAD(P)-dependent dehydrogenase (short-subunit alcohol dehydrogenase family)
MQTPRCFSTLAKKRIMHTLKGKKVVVLGGSAGIGLETAKVAANHGAQVTIVSGNQDRIYKALSELPADSKGLIADHSNEQEIAQLFQTVGNFDHLVYTAGENLRLGAIAETTLQDAKNFFEVRYWGAFAAVKYAAGQINAGGSIVLTGGGAAHRPSSGWSYVASVCAAMEGLTRALALELAPIRVNLVVPGLVKTGLWEGMDEQERENMYTHYSNILPVGYVAPPEDIAQTYIHLMEQTYATGQSMMVDGGYALI